MVSMNQIYKCSICGNVVEVIEAADGTLVCCGKDMDLIEEKTEDEGKEKHVPVVSVENSKIKVKVGSVEHPMEENHFIERIELLHDGKIVAAKQLMPGDKPEAEFCLDLDDETTARAYCNVHRLWKS